MLVPMTALGADTRHSGTVLGLGRDNLVVDELGRAGEEHKLTIAVTPKTWVVDSLPNPHAPSAQEVFTDKTIGLSDIRKGDFVVVDVSREGNKPWPLTR